MGRDETPAVEFNAKICGWRLSRASNATGSHSQKPSAQSNDSCLLDGRNALAADRCFAEPPELSIPGNLLVFNDVKAIKHVGYKSGVTS